MKKISLIIFVSFIFSHCVTTPSKTQIAAITPVVATKSIEAKRPKNIIFMIGDGMGLTQISAGYYMNKGQLNLLKLPYVGLHINYPAEDSTVITDSAAGATAFSIGEKTYNGAIGVGKDSLPRETIMETAKKKGLGTGLVVTCNIQHATPAAFVAHVKSRADYEPISNDILKSGIDIFIGGGKQFFDNRKTDSRNMVKELETQGYQVSDWNKEDLNKVNITKNKFAYFTANVQPLTAEQGRDYLPSASKMACNFLQKNATKGFFMMIEGSQIDWGGHAANSSYIVNEMLDFDKAVGEVLAFAKQDGNTLVIITADHETGGYGLTKGSNWGKVVGQFADTKPDKSGSIYHTCALIPVFAYGPGAENFTGVYQNTAIYQKMKVLFGF
jgi:alkaline phosphatase